jgi:hypothetical protein
MRVFVAGFSLAVLLIPKVQAQVAIDVSKITCDQFVHGKVGEPRTVGAWLSGFYNGKHDNPVVDFQAFQGNLNKLQTYCYDEKNFSTPVVQAIEQIGSAK